MQPVWKKFDQLSLNELYAILKLRIDVFVVEQNCPWSDLDNYDQQSWHLCFWQDGKLAAYARLLPPQKPNDEVKVARVITAEKFRGQGLGQQLMIAALEKSAELFPGIPIKIGAQERLEKFYSNLGFVPCSKPYDDLGIMHIDMIFTKPAKAA